MDKRDCIYPDCLIVTDFGSACEHSCPHEQKYKDKPKPYSRGCLARDIPGHRLNRPGCGGRVQRKPGVNPRPQDRQDVHTLPAIPLKTERLPMGNARQEIISALKGAGKNENGRPHPMSVSQIMAAIGRTDRNAVDQLLHKMRKAGEIEVAGRGLYTLGKIGAPVSAPAQSDQEQSYREGQSDRQTDQDDLTGAESGKIEVAVRLQETPDQPWRISEPDAARRADRYRAARKDKGELIATRALRWALQDAGVLYEQLEREIDRIRALAASGH